MAEKAANFTFVWAIENASAMRFADNVMSPRFSAKTLETTTWQLDIPSLEFTDPAVINLELWRLKDYDGPENIEIDFELSFLDADGLPLTKRTGSKAFTRLSYHALQFSGIFSAEITPKNVLTVRCRMWKKGSEIAKPEICFAGTRFENDRRVFVWSIADFCSLQSGQKRRRLLNLGDAELVLGVFLSEEDGAEFVGIEIDYKGAPCNPMVGEIALLDILGAVVHREKIAESVWTSNHFFKKQKLLSCPSNLLPNDALCLRCEFDIFREHTWSEIENCEQLDYSQTMAADISETDSETSDEEGDDNVINTRETLCTLIWMIVNASALRSTDHVCSPEFTAECTGMTKWHLCVENGPLFKLGIYGTAGDDRMITSLELKFEVAILGVDGGLPLRKVTTSYVRRRGLVNWVHLIPNNLIYGCSRAEFFPKDVLTVRCRMWRNNAAVQEPPVHLVLTQFVKNVRLFFCTVTGFSSLQLGQKRVMETDYEGARELVVSLYLTESDFKEYLCIDIDYSAFENRLKLEGEIALLDAEAGVVQRKKVHKNISKTSENICTFEKVFEKQELLSDKSKLLPNDNLNLRCEFVVFVANNMCEVAKLRNEIMPCEGLDSSEPMSMHMREMSVESDIAVDEANKSVAEECPFTETIKGFYNESALTDAVLETKSESFRVHKVVLCCRSAVFAAMFSEDAHGKTEHHLDIPDVDADTLRRLLSYVYTNEVSEVQWEGVADLLRVANTYELLELKQKCAEILKSNISRSNLCTLLPLAYMSQEDGLLKVVLDFISDNSDIFESEEWKTFKNLNSECAMETMERVIYSLRDRIH